MGREGLQQDEGSVKLYCGLNDMENSVKHACNPKAPIPSSTDLGPFVTKSNQYDTVC